MASACASHDALTGYTPAAHDLAFLDASQRAPAVRGLLYKDRERQGFCQPVPPRPLGPCPASPPGRSETMLTCTGMSSASQSTTRSDRRLDKATRTLLIWEGAWYSPKDRRACAFEQCAPSSFRALRSPPHGASSAIAFPGHDDHGDEEADDNAEDPPTRRTTHTLSVCVCVYFCTYVM